MKTAQSKKCKFCEQIFLQGWVPPGPPGPPSAHQHTFTYGCISLTAQHTPYFSLEISNIHGTEGTHSPLLPLRKERVDKFIVESNITSNKLQDFETVSQGSRHRSNHTQKNIPSVVAGHQFLQSGYIGPDTGLFPITENVMHPGFCIKMN